MNWNNVARELGPKLFRYFSGSFAAETASDLTQETLIRLVRKHEEGAFDSRKGNLTMFAYGIARLVRLEAWKSVPPESLCDGDAITRLPDSSGEDRDTEARVAQLRVYISEMGEPQREILLLLIDKDLTLQDIGLILNIPLNTVKSHVHRAKDVLRNRFKEEEAL